jgi:hypothetical protein
MWPGSASTKLSRLLLIFPLFFQANVRSLLPSNRPRSSAYKSLLFYFFLIRIVGGGVQAGSTRHVGHWIAYCICPGWLWWWRILWNEDWQGKPKYSEKTCPSATLSITTNPTWPDPGSNSGRR